MRNVLFISDAAKLVDSLKKEHDDKAINDGTRHWRSVVEENA